MHHLEFPGSAAVHPVDATVFEVQRVVPLVPLATSMDGWMDAWMDG